jgi:hypothetical protein
MSSTSSFGTDNERSFEPASSLVDTVFDTTLAWVDAGLGHVKATLATGGRSMLRAARALDVVRERLRA